ncbi:MAG: TIGR00282 family metallophosphoesterase [Candidatus Aceula meridiana]|nr:TIGR00282 family metallophosphoesterase [Candidatus Aceula meridiana]
MNILCIGDIVGKPGRKAVEELLPKIKEEFKINFVVANAENAAAGAGVTPRLAEELLCFGCDILTSGDHVWDKKELLESLQDNPKLLRPANFPEGTPGQGLCLTQTVNGQKIAIINLLGRVFIRYNVNCPFKALDQLVEQARKHTNIIIVDMHAEATSEKIALGHFADGKVSAVVGTHTHVQTADERILPKGTAYLTDLGMTGPFDSVIGQNKEKIIQRFLTSMPSKFEVAEGDVALSGAVITVDETGTASQITRIQRRL